MNNTNSHDLLTLLKQLPDLNVEYAINNIGESESLYEKLLKDVLRLLPANIAVMDTCIDADNDLSMFGIKAHGIKSSLRQIGCMGLAESAETLEKAAKGGDMQYCACHYSSFKARVLDFHDKLDAILQETGIESKSTNTQDAKLIDFYDTLLQANAAATGFESMPAVRSLSPLAEYHFSEKADSLVLKALDELKAFRPKNAVPYITELLEECKK